MIGQVVDPRHGARRVCVRRLPCRERGLPARPPTPPTSDSMTSASVRWIARHRPVVDPAQDRLPDPVMIGIHQRPLVGADHADQSLVPHPRDRRHGRRGVARRPRRLLERQGLPRDRHDFQQVPRLVGQPAQLPAEHLVQRQGLERVGLGSKQPTSSISRNGLPRVSRANSTARLRMPSSSLPSRPIDQLGAFLDGQRRELDFALGEPDVVLALEFLPGRSGTRCLRSRRCGRCPGRGPGERRAASASRTAPRRCRRRPIAGRR